MRRRRSFRRSPFRGQRLRGRVRRRRSFGGRRRMRRGSRRGALRIGYRM